jgi:hypothetical protein
MTQELAQPVSRTATVCSFACLGAQAVLVPLCYVFVAYILAPSDLGPQSDSNQIFEWFGRWLAVLAAMLGAVVATFEDLFLTRLRERGEAKHEEKKTAS